MTKAQMENVICTLDAANSGMLYATTALIDETNPERRERLQQMHRIQAARLDAMKTVLMEIGYQVVIKPGHAPELYKL